MNKELKILYVAGPGDVAATFHHWKNGQHNNAHLAFTYSGQFYDVCREISAAAYVVSTNKRAVYLEDGKITIDQGPIPLFESSGLNYHIGQALFIRKIARICKTFGPDVVLLFDIADDFMAAWLKRFNVKIILSVHCTFWPNGSYPSSLISRFTQALRGRFLSRHVDASICVSPECQRQIHELTKGSMGPCFQARAQYAPESFTKVSPPLHNLPFHILFAGRIEHNKGVFDLVEIASKLNASEPGKFLWTVCGDGGAFNALRQRIYARKLEHVITLTGYLNRPELIRQYNQSQMVIVPTTSKFVEGLNKVAVESILAGRPLITSRLSNAVELLGDTMIEVKPDDFDGYAQAIQRLADDRNLYYQCVAACKSASQPFFDRSQSYAMAVKRALNHIVPGCVTFT